MPDRTMHTHRNCYFFRSGYNDGFWVQYPRLKEDADFVRYENCHFYTRGKDQIIKIVDHVNGVTYVAHPDCPYFQE